MREIDHHTVSVSRSLTESSFLLDFFFKKRFVVSFSFPFDFSLLMNIFLGCFSYQLSQSSSCRSPLSPIGDNFKKFFLSKSWKNAIKSYKIFDVAIKMHLATTLAINFNYPAGTLSEWLWYSSLGYSESSWCHMEGREYAVSSGY